MDLESLPKPEGTIPRNAGVLQPFVPYVTIGASGLTVV